MAEGEAAPAGPASRVRRAVASLPITPLLFAPPRTAAFAVGTWWRGRRPLEEGEEPVPLTPAMVAQVALDEAVLAVMRSPRIHPSSADYQLVRSELEAALAMYEGRGWIAEPRGYHRDPEPLTDPRITRTWAAGVPHDRLSWPSLYEPYPKEPGRDRWLAFEANRRARARLIPCPEPDRPWLICIHGFGTGWPMADFYAFRVRRLARQLGLNVLLPVLPLHGARRTGGWGGQELMSVHIQNFVLGMAQSVWDIRRLIGWARRRGASQIGLYGMSLGAYVASLVATIEPDLDLVIAGAPVSDLPALFQTHSPPRVRREVAERGIALETAQTVHRVVSPLASEPLVEKDRRFIYAGLGDRMSTPGQARRLWEHWDRPEIAWYAGSHMTFLWSVDVATFIDRSLVDAGFVTEESVVRQPISDEHMRQPASKA